MFRNLETIASWRDMQTLRSCVELLKIRRRLCIGTLPVPSWQVLRIAHRLLRVTWHDCMTTSRLEILASCLQVFQQQGGLPNRQVQICEPPQTVCMFVRGAPRSAPDGSAAPTVVLCTFFINVAF